MFQYRNRYTLLLAMLIAVFGCSQNANHSGVESAEKVQKPVKVEISFSNGRYQLQRGGEPYFIKGAGGSRYLDTLKAYGGNSIRTWSTVNAGNILDEAHKRGLTVTMGLDVARERHGFDYNDEEAVAKQLQSIKEEVLKYKDHPALLIWGIGNELNLFYSNTKVWDAVNDIAKMIHEVDPDHPVSTMTAGITREVAELIMTKAPEVDILAVNTYAGLPHTPGMLKEFGWTKPYIIAEWGPTGHWEGRKTAWDAPIEETSSKKADVYKSRYLASIKKDTAQCLGSYVFLWGQKQERTPTWYGIFTEAGEGSEVVDVMSYLWSGKYPSNRAPHISFLKLDDKEAFQNVYLKPGNIYTAQASVTDPDNDELSYRWEILHESTDLKEGGDRESKPEAVSGFLRTRKGGEAEVTAPDAEGAYRLFVYASDGKNKVATANIPFFVRK